MKKIYITGISGLLGNNLARELLSKYEITGADLAMVDIPGISYECIDLTDSAVLRESICKAKPDVLIHTVAVVNVDQCEVNTELADKINAELTKNIAEICQEQNIKMIYISTDSVFDGESSKLYTEVDSVNPINHYAESKHQGELYTQKYSDNLILRTNIYGVNIQEKKSFGEWIVSALENDETLNMFEDIYFSPILVNDLAKVIDRCIEENISGLYHACGTGAISKYDFGMAVKKVFAIATGKINKTTSESMDFKAPRPKHMGMSNQKLCDKLGIYIRTPEESIEEFYRLCSERQER